MNSKRNSNEHNSKGFRLESTDYNEGISRDNLINETKTSIEEKNDRTNIYPNRKENESEKNEIEEIAKAISYKVVGFMKSSGEPLKQNQNNKKEADSEDDREIEEKSRNSKITDFMKDDHFYTEENSIRESRNNNFIKLLKKKSSLNVSIINSLNSIKYRLKKNYFGHRER
jgi:hypothetical protein